MSDKAKGIISVILTVIILIVCCFYTYSDMDLPGRKRQIVVTNTSSETLSISTLVEKYNDYEKLGADFSPVARDMKVHFEGKIKVAQAILDEDGRIKLISDNEYWDFGVTPLLERAFAADNNFPLNRYFIIYLNEKPVDYYLLGGKEVTFSADFYSIDHKYIIAMNGEFR